MALRTHGLGWRRLQIAWMNDGVILIGRAISRFTKGDMCLSGTMAALAADRGLMKRFCLRILVLEPGIEGRSSGMTIKASFAEPPRESRMVHARVSWR